MMRTCDVEGDYAKDGSSCLVVRDDTRYAKGARVNEGGSAGFARGGLRAHRTLHAGDGRDARYRYRLSRAYHRVITDGTVWRELLPSARTA